MTEVPGVGMLCDGFLERDPLDDSYQLRFVGSGGAQQVVRLQDVLARYCGREVRFTIACVTALQQTLERVQPALESEAAVTFADLAKEPGRT